jgi:tetratricopeptide (TPR) repeat protein
MPRAVRAHLLPLAKFGDPDILERQHQAWGSAALDELSLDQQLETHFHAVQGGKLDDAVRTARYYATDLRALALRFSRDERYHEAAELYRKIVDEFDPEDAYAWEHLGVNLALASGLGPLSEDLAAEIRNAYVRAFGYDPQNPLYHGRLLGFRARLGEDVRAEAQRGLKRYLVKYGDQSRAISHFIEPVAEGMSVNMFGQGATIVASHPNMPSFGLVAESFERFRLYPKLRPYSQVLAERQPLPLLIAERKG